MSITLNGKLFDQGARPRKKVEENKEDEAEEKKREKRRRERDGKETTAAALLNATRFKLSFLGASRRCSW